MAKIEDLRGKSDDQLTGDLAELRFQSATNQLERPARIREVRRDIARIKTLQTERSTAVKA
jgi:large subunit ribosomal protein L29